MIVRDLFKTISFEECFKALDRLNEEPRPDRDSYQQAWDEIQSLTPQDSDMTVRLTHVPAEDGCESYWDMSGRREGDDTSWALDFTDWSEILGMQVSPSQLAPPDALAVILWEMTFHGYSRAAVLGKGDDLRDMAAEVKEMIDSGDTSQLIEIVPPKPN